MSKHNYTPNQCKYCHRKFLARNDTLKIGQGQFCSRHCSNLAQPRPNRIDRFWSKVKKTDNCWIWIGGRFNHGYGSFSSYHGKRIYAHRYSWQISQGPIPDKMFVCHKCDNPPCVRPDHLFLGTHDDNMLDAKIKNRFATGVEQGRKVHPNPFPIFSYESPTNQKARGSKHGISKLTENDVRTIRQLLKTHTQKHIAAMYNMTPGTLSVLARYITWRHVR